MSLARIERAALRPASKEARKALAAKRKAQREEQSRFLKLKLALDFVNSAK